MLCLLTRLDDSGRFSHLRRTTNALYGRDLPRAPDAELLQWLLSRGLSFVWDCMIFLIMKIKLLEILLYVTTNLFTMNN